MFSVSVFTERTKDTVIEATDNRMLIENLEKNMDEEDNKDMLPDLVSTLVLL